MIAQLIKNVEQVVIGKNEIIEELKISWCGQKEKTMTYSDVKIDQYNDLYYEKQKIEKF